MRLVLMVAVVLLASCAANRSDEGNSYGFATLAADGTITLTVPQRASDTGETMNTVTPISPDNPGYRAVADWVGPIEVGQRKQLEQPAPVAGSVLMLADGALSIFFEDRANRQLSGRLVIGREDPRHGQLLARLPAMRPGELRPLPEGWRP